MRKAFDTNVPKLKPRLRPAGVATVEPEMEAPPVAAGEAAPAAVEEVEAAPPVVEEAEAAPVVAQARPLPAPPAQVSRAVKPAPAASGDLAERKERLEKIKRKVAEAARRGTPAAAPREPARAAESALSLVGDLDRQLARSRDLEEALRADLHQARTELARAAGDAEGARGRLLALEKELEDRRSMMNEMLAEMSALEEERDQSVRRAQALSALDEERQKLADELSRRGEELEAALAGTRAEAGRLTAELDERTTDGARLRAGLSETVRERDALARELAAVRSERDELLEARRALEKVHEALSQARSRLG
jgi:chromosome segregation ATPase